MSHKHCEKCDGGMRRHTLREALIDHEQECPRCHHRNELTIQDGFDTLVEDWEETHHFDGLWEQRNDPT